MKMSLKKGVQQIVVRRSRGDMVVQAIGRTGRGVKFIIAEEAIGKDRPGSPGYKPKQTAAVEKLLGSGQPGA